MQADLLLQWPPAPGAQVVVLEAAPGPERERVLEEWCAVARAAGCTQGWMLPCDAERGGHWAGLKDWMQALLPALESEARDLFTRHDAELVAVVPLLRRRVRPRYVSLSDSSEKDERVRNFATDRAWRVGAGLVELLEEWHRRTGGGRWAVACDAFDGRGALVGRFFRDLLRRRGDALGLVLLAAVSPGQGDTVAAELAPFATVHRAALDLPAAPTQELDAEAAAALAAQLEPGAELDYQAIVARGHQIARLWTIAGRPDRAVAWHAITLSVMAHFGYYEDALRHVAPLEAGLDYLDQGNGLMDRTKVLVNLRIVYITNGQPERALELLEHEGLARVQEPGERARLLYLVAMLHARHLPVRNLEKAERALTEALGLVDRSTVMEEAQRHFLTGFLLNGLAYVRMRQGDAREAAALTHANYERLEQHLPPDRHRLHRSVLLYNAGQVYARTGEHDLAIRFFSEAMEMDPNYSEYYNDRGKVYLRMGRLAEAEADFRQGIELSPPYPEVWINLGQCLTRQNRMEESEAAFARAVDLDPARLEAWTNRARALQALGRRHDALAAYDAGIAADGSHPLVLANRAALRFELGRAAEALDDLERAVALAPDNDALRQNRDYVRAALAGAGPVREPVAA